MVNTCRSMLAPRLLILAAVCLLLAAGCAARRCRSTGGTTTGAREPSGAATGAVAAECRPTARSPLVPDVSQVAALSESPNQPEVQYCELTAQEAQCRAAANSPAANMLADESAAVGTDPGRWWAAKNPPPQTSDILLLEAVEQRNSAAADALEAFYRLVEAEAGMDNLRKRLKEVNEMGADIRRLQAQGVQSPVSLTEVERQRLELLHRQTGLSGDIDRLNSLLQRQQGAELPANSRYWPQASLQAAHIDFDREQAVAAALANRAELAALRQASGADDFDKQALARMFLPLVDGTGAAPPAGGSSRRVSETSLQTRSLQIDHLLAARERDVRQETLQALAALATAEIQIGLTRRRLESAQTHLQAEQQRQAAGEGGLMQIRKDRLGLAAMEQDLLHDVIEWKLAQVRLKKAQGLLAQECGYSTAAAPASHCPAH